ncbi:MAG: universal stress protein [Desulfobacterales bacterium]|nr:universal stress protein [Desulfobacterales bacterium]
MKKNILVAVDASTQSKKAVKYALKMRSLIENLHFTLVNVQPAVSDFLVKDACLDSKAKAALEAFRAKNEKHSMTLLEKYKADMIAAGADNQSIELVSLPRTMGAAKDILTYARQQQQSAILLGRRGVSKLEELFAGSVTNAVLEHADVTPVWAIDGDVSSTKILVAVDGSQSALNAVDYVCQMMGDTPSVRFTLLHVTSSVKDFCAIDFQEDVGIVEEIIASGDQKCLSNFYSHAQQKFKAAGVAQDRISIEEVKSTGSISKTIVDEAKKGNFGIVVVGRTGAHDSFFVGSVSRYIVKNATNCAVWLVP